MIPWIQVYSNLVRHPKVTNLADELGLSSSHASPNAVAVGMLVSLWLWAAQNATDGDLSKCSDRAIAEAAECRKKPAALVAALIKTRWLDEDRKLHDWEEYATLLNDIAEDQKAKTRERVRKHRKNKMGGQTCVYCGEDATGYDHIIPKTNGGTDDKENLVPCCPDCNRQKNNRSLESFLNSSKRVNHELVQANEKLMRHVMFNGESYIPQCVTLRNATTKPNLTLPNITLPNTQNNIGTSVEITDTSVTSTAGATHGLQYGSRQNVSLTQSEYDRLILDFGETNVTVAIETMGRWLAESGEKPESHYALLRRKLWKNPTLRATED